MIIVSSFQEIVFETEGQNNIVHLVNLLTTPGPSTFEILRYVYNQ